MSARTFSALVAVATVFGANAFAAGHRDPATYTVVIDKMKFGATPGGLKVGDTIVWVNRDLFEHTATADDRSFNADMLPGKSARTVLGRVGSVSFHCAYHPGMKGTLVVAAR